MIPWILMKEDVSLQVRFIGRMTGIIRCPRSTRYETLCSGGRASW